MLVWLHARFREVDVWAKAHQLTLDIYRTTDSLPKREMFGLTIQLRRMATVVPTRIVEGCSGDGDSEFAPQLRKARIACSELEYLLLLSRDLGYLSNEVHERLLRDLVEVRKMLSGLLRRM